MSIIPKIAIGIATRKNRHNLSCDSQTTLNFGEVIPTFCRELLPNSKVSFDYRSLVRLGSMPRPTFGRMSLRNYATFQKYSDIWEPWNAFLAQQPFTESDGTQIIPQKVPTFSADIICKLMLRYSVLSSGVLLDLTDQTTYAATRSLVLDSYSQMESLGFTFPAPSSALRPYIDYSNPQNPDTYDGADLQTTFEPYNPNGIGGYYVGDGYIIPFVNSEGDYLMSDLLPDTLAAFKSLYSVYQRKSQESDDFVAVVPSPESFDFVYAYSRASGSPDNIYFKFKPILKHFRKIFIGLGYQFAPLDAGLFNPLKLFAYYKAWFEIFRPQRNIQYTDTRCYKICKQMESITDLDNTFLFTDFMFEDICKDTFYYFPADYFSMSLRDLGDNTLDNSEYNSISSPLSGNVSTGYSDSTVWSSRSNNGVFDVSGSTGSVTQDLSRNILFGATTDGGLRAATGGTIASPTLGTSNLSFSTSSNVSSLVINIANRLLQFTNKNNIIGRNIRDYLRVHYGIIDDNIASNGVHRVGNSRINIDTHEVINMSETELAYLGEYAGRGIGSGSSDRVTFDTDNQFGVLINFTVIVPESGYYQGVLRENISKERYDYFTDSFDAMGYEVISNREFKDDYESKNLNSSSYSNQSGFGFVPRYSHYKVGRNIVNGDLSLPSMRNSMSPYTLDKQYGQLYRDTHRQGAEWSYTQIPKIVNDSMRKLDMSSILGNFNRIFNYKYSDVDHFIVQQVYDVNVWNNAKSLSSSFDTFEDGNDNSTVDLIHQ